ncbi:MAG: nucleotidyltransferase domain-containing protein [Gemmatimonadaceae bacterium]
MAKMKLDELVTQLRAVYGDALSALVLYGSAAGGEYHEKRSDMNVLVIAKSLTVKSMRAAGAVARAWGEAGHPPPLTLTEAEWRSSVDVFAMEHADIIQRHKILFSSPSFNLLSGVSVSPRDLRLQLEYEALGALLRLRGRVLTSDHDAAKRLEMLVSGTSQVLVLFRATLRIRDEVPPSDNEALCRLTASHAGFDPAPFIAVLGHWRGGKGFDLATLDTVLEAYHSGLEQLVAYLDLLPEGA